MDATIANLRREYAKQALDEQSVAAEPLAQFRLWFDAALASGIVEPNAMLLSTADADGRPSARVVLLKDIDDRGLSFYTNYNSRKADDIAANPRRSEEHTSELQSRGHLVSRLLPDNNDIGLVR